MSPDDPCPCGRGVRYAECCGPLHAGVQAPTAERLMRSRFSAFSLGLGDYLFASWARATRPDRAELDPDPDTRWLRLFIEETEAGGPFDESGIVVFTAIARGPEGRIELRERSRFVREGNDRRWVYLDGEIG
ncbi:SEC-C domain-containing protein [Leucobacter sp. CSA2]|uniref:SEC-C domain-containing protein n=1 Tax=Leucobacter edaphi TaxID=2796472 RepID=A0A934UVV9_9MICO|nr:SEC-C domain-containing protein [Leucobacter edaphi]